MDKLEFIFIIVEFVLIGIEVGLCIYQIYLQKQSDKQMKQLLNK